MEGMKKCNHVIDFKKLNKKTFRCIKPLGYDEEWWLDIYHPVKITKSDFSIQLLLPIEKQDSFSIFLYYQHKKLIDIEDKIHIMFLNDVLDIITKKTGIEFKNLDLKLLKENYGKEIWR